MNIRIYNYNNYYNRIVKKLTVDSPDYGEYIYEILNANFNPNDGITTQHIFGNNVNTYDGSGDYLLCIDSNNEIISRWFIIENVRNRGGQWTATLKRDTIVDYYDNIINADTYIEKAILQDDNDLIFNKENLELNKIKKNQIPLKDSSNSGWIVAYLPTDLEESKYTTLNTTIPIDYSFSIDGIQNWDYYQYSNLAATPKKAYTNITSKFLNLYVLFPTGDRGYLDRWGDVDKYSFPLITDSSRPFYKKAFLELNPSSIERYELWYPSYRDPAGTALLDKMNNNLLSNIQSVENIFNQEFNKTIFDNNIFTDLNGKVIKDVSNDTYYRISVKNINSSAVFEKGVEVGSGQDLTLVNNILGADGAYYEYLDGDINRLTLDIEKPSFYFEFSGTELRVELNVISEASHTATLPTTARYPFDSPYRILCMPYVDSESVFKFKYNDTLYEMNNNISLGLAQNLIKNLSGSNNVYDVQFLPYCPVLDFIDDDGIFNLNNIISITGDDLEGDAFTLVKTTDDKLITGFICFANTSSFSTQINFTINPKNIKIDNQTDLYRLCSPTFNGAFEFNIAKNRGLVGFNVSCTYKPYTPYIKIVPIFGGLYGQNFQDPRGCICGGDFGISLVSDKWATYELNNKNYLNTFNRQIENMEVSQSVEREKQIWQIVSGSVSGTASGAFTGASIGGGNPLAAALGGAVSGVASTLGGIRDVQLGDILRNEAIDYTKDQFNYSLQNIQALPYSLNRVSSLNNDFTIFPILEYYSCTDIEKKALAEKIAWNGMTVMAIGKLRDYIGNVWSYTGTLDGKEYTITSKGYIKGRIIRLENILDDFHIATDIASEISKGVYL